MTTQTPARAPLPPAGRSPRAAGPPAPTHLDGVDGLRGLAALTIVVYHLFGAGAGGPELRLIHHVNVLRPLHDGWCGVNLFLVLSGFCLFWPYARNPERRLQAADFMRRRVRRIVPAYYASLLFVIVAYLFTVHVLRLRVSPYDVGTFPHGVLDVVLHLLLLHSLTAATITSWNSVSWSLGLEWTWYLVFPLAVLLYRRFGPGRGLLAMALLAVAYRLGLYLHFGPAGRFPSGQLMLTDALRNFVVGRLFEFGAGMAVAWWLANRAITQRMVHASLALFAILLVLAHAATPVDPFIPVRDLLYGTAFALLLLVSVSGVRNAVQRALSGRLLRGIGEHSYSLYLFHMPFVVIVAGLLRQHGISGARCFFVSLLSIPAILVFSKLAYLAFEKPFMSPAQRKEREVDGAGSGPGAAPSTPEMGRS